MRNATAAGGAVELGNAAAVAANELPFASVLTPTSPDGSLKTTYATEAEATAARSGESDGIPQNPPESPTSAHFALPSLPSAATNPRQDRLTPAQRLAVAAIVCGRTYSAAAVQAGVDRSTIYQWRKLPAFTEAIEHYSREALEATAMRARSLLLKSTRALAESLNEQRRHADSRFSWACRMVNSRHLWTLAQTIPAREEAE